LFFSLFYFLVYLGCFIDFGLTDVLEDLVHLEELVEKSQAGDSVRGWLWVLFVELCERLEVED
jgi:hypothetical protein